MDKSDLIYDIVSKIDNKIDKVDDKVDSLHINVNTNTIDLKEHMKRTKLGEDRIKHIENKLTISYLVKVVTSTIITAGAVAGALYQVIRIAGKS